MLIPKLLRIDEATIQEIEQLAQDLSQKEHISFSALVRKLIRIGLDDMKSEKETTFVEKIKNTSSDIGSAKQKVLLAVKQDIEESAGFGYNQRDYSPWSFNMVILRALNKEVNVNMYFNILQYVMESLCGEGFQVKCDIDTAGDVQFIVSW